MSRDTMKRHLPKIRQAFAAAHDDIDNALASNAHLLATVLRARVNADVECIQARDEISAIVAGLTSLHGVREACVETHERFGALAFPAGLTTAEGGFGKPAIAFYRHGATPDRETVVPILPAAAA